MNSADARLFASLSYGKLVAASDLVAIVTPIATKAANDAYPGQLYGHNTEFKVLAILKGEKPARNLLTVLHFSYAPDIGPIQNGARFIHFAIGPLEFKKQNLQNGKEVGGITVYAETPTWLAFLKRREDGRDEPVTEPYDSADSFRELHQASFFVPMSEAVFR